MGSRLASLVVWIVVAASAAYWGLRLFVRGPSAPATLTVAESRPPAQADWTRLFGADAVRTVAAAPEPAADARFHLVGLVAPRGRGNLGVALIGVDGKPARAYKPGATVDGALVLQGIQQREVTLGPAGGGAQIRLQLPPLPVAATGTLPVAGAPVLPSTPRPGLPVAGPAPLSPAQAMARSGQQQLPFGAVPGNAPGALQLPPQITPMPDAQAQGGQFPAAPASAASAAHRRRLTTM